MCVMYVCDVWQLSRSMTDIADWRPYKDKDDVSVYHADLMLLDKNTHLMK